MNRSELLNRLAHAEWNVSHGARRLAQHRHTISLLRTHMRDVSNAEDRLTDLAAEHLYSVSERDQLRVQLKSGTQIHVGIVDP